MVSGECGGSREAVELGFFPEKVGKWGKIGQNCKK
jgi:hypothetical protein